MSSAPDRRFWRANERVGHPDVAGVAGVEAVAPTPMRVAMPLADLCHAPGQGRDKVLLHGDPFDVLETHGGAAFGYDPRDGYVGYVAAHALASGLTPTHRVSVRMAHIYSEPDIKSAETGLLSLGSQVEVRSMADGFVTLASGDFMVARHVRPVRDLEPDWVAVAEALLGTPYLWGGNSAFGIDCSGLVQLAMTSAGHACPRDSDLQEGAFPVLGQDDLSRGDLVFWAGHVGIMTGAETLLHANAHHMAVVEEPLGAAIDRIGKKEFGAVTGCARPPV